MSSDALQGKFDSYANLTDILKQNGISRFSLSSALRKIASDNNIDNIREIDGTQEITISQSIFNSVQPEEKSDAVDYFNKDPESITQKPIVNYDEYDVADYDDYYGFEAKETNQNTMNQDSTSSTDEQDNEKMDFETFKQQYSGQFTSVENQDEAAQNEMMLNAFNNFDTNLDGYLNSAEIAAMAFKPSVTNEDDNNDNNEGTEDDPFAGAMEMDMSNNAFNA